MKTDELTFTNLRRLALIDDWPFGRQTCRARFVVESHPRLGQRVARYTENKARTGWNKPKRTTYAKVFVIADGSDEKTYLLSTTRYGDMANIWPGTMKTIETVHGERALELRAQIFAMAEGGAS